MQTHESHMVIYVAFVLIIKSLNFELNCIKFKIIIELLIFQGKIFYVTPSVVPAPSAFAEIIESAGGTFEKTRRSLAQIQEINATKVNYIIITQANDLHLLSDVLRANVGKLKNTKFNLKIK